MNEQELKAQLRAEYKERLKASLQNVYATLRNVSIAELTREEFDAIKMSVNRLSELAQEALESAEASLQQRELSSLNLSPRYKQPNQVPKP